MPVALIPKEIWTYRLEQDPVKTRFTLRALTGSDVAIIRNLRATMGPGTADQFCLQKGLRGWDLRDPSGKPVEFRSKESEGDTIADESNLDYLTADDQAEIARAIWRRTKVTEAEEKNSDSADTSSRPN